MKKLSIILFVLFITFATAAHARTVHLRSVSAGIYEDGKFTPDDSGFAGTLFIDEGGKSVTVEKIVENNREGRFDRGAEYEITSILMSEGPSALLVSRNKKGQKIITAVRDVGLGASETLILGDDYYEFSRAANGRFYLEYGKVTKAGQK